MADFDRRIACTQMHPDAVASAKSRLHGHACIYGRARGEGGGQCLPTEGDSDAKKQPNM